MPQPQSHLPIRAYGPELGTIRDSQAYLPHPILGEDGAQAGRGSDAEQAGALRPLSRGRAAT